MATDPVIDNQKFIDDNNALLAAAKAVQEQLAEAQNDMNTFKEKLKKLSSDPQLALMELFYLLYASPNDSTMGGQIQDKMGITGEQLKLNGALTAVNNDLNNMINSNNNNPQSMNVMANDMSMLKGELSGDKSNPFYNKYLDPNSANPSMDPGAEKSVFNQLAALRKLFYIPNPNVPSDNPTSSETFYFDDTGADGKISSFYQYQQDLGQKGDVQGSTDAAKLITDDFATSTQTTQTASAVLNNDMKTLSPLLQTIQQFDSTFAQSMNAVIKAAINHTSTG